MTLRVCTKLTSSGSQSACSAAAYISVRTEAARSVQHRATADASIAQQQHLCRKLALQQGKHAAQFAELYGGELGVKDDMGATFHQQHTAGLRKGAAREFVLAMVGKHR